jgi:8-oxo-dGTP pyrophosphatase MutT (NUDIX family)
MVHVRRGDEWLVAHRARDAYWHPIAGKVEQGEDWATAARRELREETGLDAEVRPIGTFAYDPGVEVHAFLARAPAGWEPTLDHEHDAYRWCGVDEACALLRWPEPRELLRAL